MRGGRGVRAGEFIGGREKGSYDRGEMSASDGYCV